MKAEILARVSLSHLPSASGMEIMDTVVFVVGDDSPYLYRIREDGSLIGTIPLFETADFGTGRIPKKEKPDLEAMTICLCEGKKQLLIFGSGSKSEKRDICFLVEPDDGTVRKISLVAFYAHLREQAAITGGHRLNIEAAAATQHTLFLFQRGNVSGINILLSFTLQEFCDNVLVGQVLTPTLRTIFLPTIHGCRAGLSGATILPGEDTILFTASLEDTKSEIEDGKVYGSIIGTIPVVASAPIHEKVEYAIVREDGEPYRGKIESVAVLEKIQTNQWKVLAVTDDDLGGSELLHIQVTTDE